MWFQLAADLTLIAHLLFIVFVLFGGLLALHRKLWIWFHFPAILWALWVEWAGKTCPLTPLENHFRQLASAQRYSESFVEHYLVPLIYPDTLTVSMQLALGGIVLLANIFVYLYVFQRENKTRRVDD